MFCINVCVSTFFLSRFLLQSVFYTGSPRYMRSFYLRFRIYENEKLAVFGTYPLIYGDLSSFYMQIHYMPA